MYQATKIIDGFSTCFRQWRAKSHCRFIHGYALKFEVTFQGENLDSNNWVMDFGFLKEPLNPPIANFKNLKEYLDHLFDHTTFVSWDDPEIETFRALDSGNLIKLREMEKVSCEKFAKRVFDIINECLILILEKKETQIVSVKCIENEKNSATYYG